MVRRPLVLMLVMATCALPVGRLGATEGASDVGKNGSSSGGVAVSSECSAVVLADAESYKEPEFVGSYRPDGKFKAVSRLDSALSAEDETAHERLRLAEVPPWIDLQDRRETVIEDYAVPAHARKAFRAGKTRAASLLESIAVFAYGREAVLRAPTHVITDSRQRIIISDPQTPAVHVLDGRSSFRIAGGPGRRLQHPNGVAVDGRDNIYVADSKNGMVLVYNPEGRFLHSVGSFKGEKMFQEPTGIAIDRNKGRLYVLDSPANELIVLDLKGNVLQRAGGRRRKATVDFSLPTQIAVGDSSIVVLDSSGTRLQVFDLNCNRLNGFAIRAVSGPPRIVKMGLALDRAGNIYVSNGGWPGLRIYKQDGHLVGAFGRFGRRSKEFNTPSGIWVDPADRIYVADTNNSRVQVFQATAQASQSCGGH